MQHHAHAPPPSQSGTHRHAHHIALPPGQQQRPLSMAHTAPPPRAPPQTHSQQKRRMSSNGSAPKMSPPALPLSISGQHQQEQAPPHTRNRMDQQQHSMHLPANSVPKMRPPHHLNMNNNNKILNKNYNPPLQYNHANGAPQQMAATQHHPSHRNMPSQHCPSHNQYLQKVHILHLKNQQQHASNQSASHKYQYQQPMLQSSLRHLNPYYTANKKSKNTKPLINVSPKTILKNPNRLINVKPNADDASAGVDVIPHKTAAESTDVNNAASPDADVKEKTDATEIVEAQKDYNVDTVQSVALEDDLEESDKENLHEKVEEDSKKSKESDVKNDQSKILSNVADMADKRSSNDKTSMCLVNELARYNQISHQYRLTSEDGPPHSKRFTVTLTLGNEEFSADGCKIKKAQHMAAAEAIKNTKYKHPTPKPQRRNDDVCVSRPPITPTVELNALAMKLGQQTFYFVESSSMSQPENMSPPPDGLLPSYGLPSPAPSQAHPLNGHMMQQSARMMESLSYMRRNGVGRGGFMPPQSPYVPPPHGPPPHGPPPHGPPPHVPPPLVVPPALFPHGRPGLRPYPSPRYNGQRHLMIPPHPMLRGMPPTCHHPYDAAFLSCKVTLIVGKQKFVGTGRTMQHAKHDAASRALHVLRKQATDELNEALDRSLLQCDSKSPISLVHEICIKRHMSVQFKVLKEEGPAHMKMFVTACIVGNIVTEAEGNGKKVSKKRAAEKMLEELKKLPPLSPVKTPAKRSKTPKSLIKTSCGAARGERRKCASGTIKGGTDADADVDNPITRLIQLQQHRKEKEPIFEIIAKSGNENSQRREFIIEAMVEGHAARGTGGTKKLAKRKAAQNLLIALGEEKDANVSKSKVESKNSRKSYAKVEANNNNPETESSAEDHKEAVEAATTAAVSASSSNETDDLAAVSSTVGPVPGILILRQSKKNALKKLGNEAKKQDTETPADPAAISDKAVEDTNKDPKNSPTTSTSSTPTVTSTKNCTSSVSSHMRDELLYLAKLGGFEVNFSDYPKGNHKEFLTIVTLSTDPSQICHGVGTSSAESQNDAAKNALKILSELGLNNMKK